LWPMNFHGRQLDGHDYVPLVRKGRRWREKHTELLVDVLVDAGVGRAYGIWSELASDPEPIPRVLEIGIQTAISHHSVSVIAHTMRSTRLWRDSGLSFERAAVGSWIAVGAAKEVVAT
jgi:hypothetical protein